jgi:cob(I)alamin adenosyltransferase
MNRKSPDKTKPVVAKKGLVIAYIGDGKGKTTAAMGTAVRAAGAGMDVYILQFVKAKEPKDGDKLQPGEWPLSSEINYFRSVSGDSSVGKIDSEQCGAGFVGILGDRKEKDAHIREAIRGLTRAREEITSGKYGLVVLDEILSAVDLKLLEERDILDLIASKPADTHLLMTGHEKHAAILKACDVVTVMQMKKHAYYSGVLAQKGIDF